MKSGNGTVLFDLKITENILMGLISPHFTSNKKIYLILLA